MSNSDVANYISSLGISNSSFNGISNTDLKKVGIDTKEEQKKVFTKLVLDNGEKTRQKWIALKNLLDPQDFYGLIITSVVREGSTDHSQGLAIDISTNKSPKYLFRFYVERLVPYFWRVKWAQQFRSVEADQDRLQKHGIYKIFLSLHNYHMHISTNPNRGNAFGYETYNGKGEGNSANYPIVPYNAENNLKAMNWYNVTVSELVLDNSLEVVANQINGIGNSVVDKATESPSTFIATIGLVAIVVGLIALFFGGKK